MLSITQSIFNKFSFPLNDIDGSDYLHSQWIDNVALKYMEKELCFQCSNQECLNI